MIRKLDLNNSLELKKAYTLISQLRPHLNLETFLKLIVRMEKEYYELWSMEEDGVFKGLLGMREYTDYVRGPHLYIDDLIVEKGFRSQGIGAKLLRFAQEEAQRRKLPSLRLACAIANTGAAKFYERETWVKRSFSYVKEAASLL